jgi:hypothetical protein
MKESDGLEYMGVGGRMILKCMWKVRWEGMDCIYLVQSKDHWQEYVNTVVNFGS